MRFTAAGRPAVVYDMPDDAYRRYPAVSYSGLKTILDCPARYRWQMTHRVDKPQFDFGHAVHAMVLGAGATIAVLDYPDRRTKAYKQDEADARAAGLTPMLAKDHERARDCADAALAHPVAGPYLAAPGAAEVSVFWTDERTGIPCKARIDKVIHDATGMPVLVDVKTVGQSADPASFARACASFAYHVQAAFYPDGWHAATGEDAAFTHIVIETDPPHLTSVVNLDDASLNAGIDRYEDALDTYARCRESGVWPGYTESFPATITLPAYAL